MRTNVKCFRPDQSSVWTKRQPRMGNQLPHVLAFKNKGYLLKNISSSTRQTIKEFFKAYFPARNQKGTEGTNSMMRLLSLGHSSFPIWSKQLGVINHWLRRQIDKKKMSSDLFFNLNPLDAYLINQSLNPGKLTFVNASFWGKRAAFHKLRRPFNFDL